MSRHKLVAARLLPLGFTSLIGAAPLEHACAAVLSYTDGSNDASPIVLSDSSTQLQVASGSATQSGAISSGGQLLALEKTGSGVLTLSGASTYTGPISVAAGTLNITGSIPGSSVTVSNGATLSGTGTVGPTTIAAGGTLSPGVGSSIGTMNIAGSLHLAAGSNTVINVSPSAASEVITTGSAVLNGTMSVNSSGNSAFAFGQRFTVMHSAAGLSGTFASVSSNLPAYFSTTAAYDANNAYVLINQNLLSSSLASTAGLNQKSIATGIDSAVGKGAVPAGGMLSLYALSGAELNGGLSQISGEIRSDVSQIASLAFEPFFNLLMQSANFGNGIGVSSADNDPAGVRPAQLKANSLQGWVSAYGGHSAFGANSSTGAQALSNGTDGIAAGLQSQFDDALLLGASIAGGRDTFASSARQSSGSSTDLMLALYGRASVFGQGYLAGAVSYGWHNIATLRTVTISGTDVLHGHFVAGDFGGRTEGGYSLALDNSSQLTGYAALAGNEFSAPGYNEMAVSGSSEFALSYAASDTGLLHSEMGGRLDHDFSVSDDVVSAELHAAWAHQIEDSATTQASFQNLANSSFAVTGALLPTNSAMVGAGLELESRTGLSASASFDTDFAPGFTAIAGSLKLAYGF